jgi:hypothetical protein
MSEQDRISKGQRAASEWRESEEAFAKVEGVLIRELTQTPVGASQKVLNLHMAVQNLAAVRQAIRAVIDDGLMAEHAVAVAGLTRPT